MELAAGANHVLDLCHPLWHGTLKLRGDEDQVAGVGIILDNLAKDNFIFILSYLTLLKLVSYLILEINGGLSSSFI